MYTTTTTDEPNAASSQWWAWLVDMKPVWRLQEGLPETRRGESTGRGDIVIGGLACRRGVRRVAGIRPDDARPRPDSDRLSRSNGSGLDRPGRFQSHDSTSLAFRCSPSRFPRRALATGVVAHVAAARWGGRRDFGSGDFCGPDRRCEGFVKVDRRCQSQACPRYSTFLLTNKTARPGRDRGVAVLVLSLFGPVRRRSAGDAWDRRTDVSGARVTLAWLGYRRRRDRRQAGRPDAARRPSR